MPSYSNILSAICCATFSLSKINIGVINIKEMKLINTHDIDITDVKTIKLINVWDFLYMQYSMIILIIISYLQIGNIRM